MAFVRWIYTSYNITKTNQFIVGIQYGFRIFAGNGNFNYNSAYL